MKNLRSYILSKRSIPFLAIIFLLISFTELKAQRQMEYLDRGVVAVRTGASQVYVSWRFLGTDPDAVSFNLYRGGIKVNATPITGATNFTDNTNTNSTYTVKPVIGGIEQSESKPSTVWAQPYLTIAVDTPASGTTPAGELYTYTANDCSAADLDGDGEYELVVKWDPSNSKDNSLKGYTGNVYIDAYKLNGTKLWRIDLGRNIRAGAHYTQFMVYDFDGDGKAEMACKTADGTIDGKGKVIGDPAADYRNHSSGSSSYGYVLSGPEFLTMFNGLTGAAIDTKNYLPARGTVSSWGDSYGNRVDRFIAAVAYVDGVHPSLIMGRGYYTRLVRVAWDFANGQLTHRWTFDSNTSGNSAYAGQGNHQMTVGDLDGDGKDEIVNGSSAINDDGTGYYSTGNGHGDALHMTDMDLDRLGMEVWMNYEEPAKYAGQGLRFRDGTTGATVWGLPTSGDVGRSMAADIDSTHPGYEMWGTGSGTYSNKGVQITTSRPSINFGIWWDGDLSRELLDGVKLDKWNPASHNTTRLMTASDYTANSNNSTKANPGLQADLFGDWREEIVYRSDDKTKLLVFTTTIPTSYRIRTLMHNLQYREAIAWQNSAYNQPPYPNYFFGTGMTFPSQSQNIYLPHSPNNLCNNSNSATFSSDIAGNSYQWQVNTGSGFTNIADNANYSGTNSSVLHISNLNSSWYGYQYRNIVDGNSITFSIRFTNRWIGSVNTEWQEPLNWSCGVLPDENTDVIIDQGNVDLNFSTTIRSLTLSSNATLTTHTGNQLKVVH